MSNLPCGEKTKKDADDVCIKTCTSSEKCWIERPKYFSGQLLTDADLRAEQNYFIEKNKLHNRYLHGWGVVCGLKVKCYPCCSGHGSSGKVVVEPGYAIDCCGNDIVVCNEQGFDVVKRINEIKKKKKAESDPCAPAAEPTTAPCPDKEDKYYLIIKYKEEDAKPATALKANDGCSIQKCVPSRTKECYELDLIEHCTLEKKPDDNFWTRARECIKIFMEIWKKLFGQKENKYPETAEEVKKFIREYYKALPDHVRCDVLDELDDIQITDDTGANMTNAAALSASPNVSQLYALLFYLLLDCICQALLNPCPDCSEDDVVILATITVKNNKIEKICNLSRKWVMTFPTLFYWMPINKGIGDFVKKVCCELDITKRGSYAPWVYMTKIVENDFTLPDTIAKNFQKTFKTIPKNLIETLNPENISLENALNKKSSESKAILKGLKVDVVGTETYEPSLEDVSLDRIISTLPYAKPGSKVIQLVDKEDNVVGFRTVKVEKAAPERGVAELRKELDDIKANISIMKSHMRRDTGSIIKTRLAVKEDYLPLTIELTRSLTKEIPPEALKDVEDVRGGKLKKAKISSVYNVLEAVPADVSDAVDEPMANALKYVNNAENLTLEVASSVAEELEKARITKKEEMNKLDTKKIATKLKISETKVRNVIKKIRKA